jgi:hypothetical protein
MSESVRTHRYPSDRVEEVIFAFINDRYPGSSEPVLVLVLVLVAQIKAYCALGCPDEAIF